MSHARLPALRRALAGLDPGAVPAVRDVVPLGPPALDGVLAGGLARAAVHEAYAPAGTGDAAAATGFGLGVALRAAAARRLVWVAQDFAAGEAGRADGAGLLAFGGDPDRVVLVRVADPAGGLRAAHEAVRCPALGAVLVEVWGEPKGLDPMASRRLAFAAAHSGVTLVVVRLGAEPVPSAAATRWSVTAAPSRPLEAGAPGRPAFAATLLRHRAGIAGRTWHLEWDRDRVCFDDPAPLSRCVVSVPAGGEVAADRRRAG